jgi:hypothetical protein
MKTIHLPLRAAAAVLLIAVIASALASCGRASKSLTPDITGQPTTWTNTISHIFADRSEGTSPTGCSSCHHAGTGIPDWTSYDLVVTDTTNIVTRLSNPTDTMRSFLKPGEADVVIAWVHAGVPK